MKSLIQLTRYAIWTLGALTLLAAVFTFTPLSRWLAEPLVRNESPNSADAIIILGGGLVKHPDTGNYFLPWGVEERIHRGIELYRAGYADTIVFTGGQLQGRPAESGIMRAYAVTQGVPSSAIIEEPASTSTYENATLTKSIYDKQGWEEVLLVTSYYHTNRACQVFEEQGYDLTCVSADRNPSFAGNYLRNIVETRGVVREYLATVYYWMAGYL